MRIENRALDVGTVATPAGALSVAVDGDTVVASGFAADAGELLARFAHTRGRAYRQVADLGRIGKALALYFDGDPAALDDVAVEQSGTVFQQRIWQLLRAVPPGTTVSYAGLAQQAGNPAAVRAAANACARNAAAPIVPCHRVVRSDGTLGGYAYGLPVKRWLLDHERAAGTRR